MKTSHIRSFQLGDIPAVAALWMRVFRQSPQPASDDLRRYIRDIFFQSPWVDLDLPSLVYENSLDEIVGFLGVLPRRILFQGRPLRMAVATQLMVDPSKRRGLAAIELIRRFFAGEQDLSFSDGANAISRRLWRSSGGEAAGLYCLEWVRILRPISHAGLRLETRPMFADLARSCALLWRGADALLSGLRRFTHANREEGTIQEATTDALLRCWESMTGDRSLRSEHDRQSLEWLLGRCAESRRLGTMRKALVRDAHGHVAGWFIYYVARGQVAQVLQLGADLATAGLVLDCLFRDAWRHGAAAVSGQVDPRLLGELTARKCRLSCPGLDVLVHSRRPEILSAVHRGDAMLTRLDGEWWLRLGIDRHLNW